MTAISVWLSNLWLDVTAYPWRIRSWSLKRNCSWMVHLHFSWTPFLQRIIGWAVLTWWNGAVSHGHQTLNCRFQKTFSNVVADRFRVRWPRGATHRRPSARAGHAPWKPWHGQPRLEATPRLPDRVARPSSHFSPPSA